MFSPREEERIFDAVIFLRRWKFNAMIYLPQCRGVKISCCNIIIPWGRNIMARVNILYLNVHPGVRILYNKFTQGCSYYIISPPGGETLGEWKYYLTPDHRQKRVPSWPRNLDFLINCYPPFSGKLGDRSGPYWPQHIILDVYIQF